MDVKSRWTGKSSKRKFRIAVARDEAFNFIYQDTLDLIQHFGGTIDFFSPLRDTRLPEGADWLYVPGGYPELHAERLSANKKLLKAIREFGISNRVIIGECGGLMYLGKALTDETGTRHPMAGVFNFSTTIRKKQLSIGYRKFGFKCKETGKNLILKGHEFHSSSFLMNREKALMEYKIPGKNKKTHDGYNKNNCYAFYSHIYWGSSLNGFKYFLNRV